MCERGSVKACALAREGRLPRSLLHFSMPAPPHPHTPTLPHSASPGRLHAFTLVELLLVLAIIAIVTAVTVPMLMKSVRGNRLRTACRTVVMAGRYARSMAVLKQCEMIVTFDLDGGRVSVSRGGPPVPAAAPAADSGVLSAREADAAPTNAPAAPAGEEELVRVLDQVRITFVETGDQEVRGTGSARAVYASNGRCAPYTVGVQDEGGAAVTIEVDALASARTRGGSG